MFSCSVPGTTVQADLVKRPAGLLHYENTSSKLCGQKAQYRIDLVFRIEHVGREANAVQPAPGYDLDLHRVALPHQVSEFSTIAGRGQRERDHARSERSGRRSDNADTRDVLEPPIEPISQRSIVALYGVHAHGLERLHRDPESNDAGEVADAARMAVVRSPILQLHRSNGGRRIATHVEESGALRCHEPFVAARRICVAP